jgi:hypothetical protein
VREGLVVPESAVLEHEPSPGLAQPTPALSLVTVPTNPPRGIQIAAEAEILFVRNKVRIGRVHVGFWRVARLPVQG